MLSLSHQSKWWVWWSLSYLKIMKQSFILACFAIWISWNVTLIHIKNKLSIVDINCYFHTWFCELLVFNMNSVRSDQNLSILSDFISLIFFSSCKENLVIFDQSFLSYLLHVRKMFCSELSVSSSCYKWWKLKDSSISDISVTCSSKAEITFLLRALMS